MKTLKLTTVSIVVFALLLAGCNPFSPISAVTRGLTTVGEKAQSALSSQKEAQAAPSAAPAKSTTNGGPAGSSANHTGSDIASATHTSVENTTSSIAVPESLGAFQTTFEQIYEQVNPSVVNIQVEVTVQASNSPFGRSGSQGTQEGLGSGFVWDNQGHIVTNNHVVEGADRILVTFADDTTVEAKVVGTDAQSDLAVIKVDPSKVDLHPVTLADSSQVKVGQVAIAIGNPYGFSGTMTQGIVSALERSLPVSSSRDSLNQSGSGSYTIPDIIQTDAAINPGNSGGVLVNTQGEVMGVTAAITSSSDSNSGIGFVIPSNIVSRVVPVLIQSGKYEHPRIGISGMTLTADMAKAMGLDVSQRGVVVMDVTSGGPAEKAGLQGGTGRSNSQQQVPVGGDVITAIDGQAIHNFEDLSTYLFYNTEVGQKITITILRDGKEQTVQLTLATVDLSQQQ